MGNKFVKINSINSSISENPEAFVKLSEDIYHNQLEAVAQHILLECNEKPLILLSGPSGSGKTTSALRIGKLVEEYGIKVHTISMDNYFIPGDINGLPKDENGNPDLESPLRLDIPLFSEHLYKLFKCEKIQIPVFDFATQSRINYIPVQRKKNEVIIIEGIHALNPMVTGATDSFTTCVYVSVRTRLKNNNGEILHPRKIRLMRRLGRDKLFRGRKLEDIFAFFESVSKGEDLYIMPHKHRAAFDIDTFIPYEAAVYKDILLPGLLEINDIMQYNNYYGDIVKFLKELDSLPEKYVPNDSIVREFIGGSTLSY